MKERQTKMADYFDCDFAIIPISVSEAISRFKVQI